MMSLSAWMRAAVRRRDGGKEGRGGRGGRGRKEGEEGEVSTTQVLRGPHSPSPCSAAVVSSFTTAKRMHTYSLGVHSNTQEIGLRLCATNNYVQRLLVAYPAALCSSIRQKTGMWLRVHRYIVSQSNCMFSVLILTWLAAH